MVGPRKKAKDASLTSSGKRALTNAVDARLSIPALSKKEKRDALLAKRNLQASNHGMLEAPKTFYRPAMSIDQALDDTGWCCIIPNVNASTAGRVAEFVSSALNSSYPELRASQEHSIALHANILAALTDVLIGSVAGRHVVIPAQGRERLPRSACLIIKSGSDAVVITHGTISSNADDIAEWRRVQYKARSLGSMLARFKVLLSRSYYPHSMHVTYEGLALGGSPLTKKNLPVLGLVAGRLIEGLVEDGGISPEQLLEMPISSWKLAFAGHPLADKNMVKKRLELLTGIVFARQDEDNVIDATAMAILEATSPNGFGKPTNGRILPKQIVKKTSVLSPGTK